MKKGTYKLHWFWEIATKWYFFPVFYTVLGFLMYMLNQFYLDKYNKLNLFLLTLFFIPNGLFYFTFLLSGNKEVETTWLFFPYFYFSFVIISIIIIQYWKLKKNLVLRWLIIILILIILLSFTGCVIGGTNWDYLKLPERII